MPIKQSAFKHLRQTNKITARNVKVKRQLKEFIKSVRKEITAGDKEKLQKRTESLDKIIDKAAQKGIIKKNNAARRKSRLTKQINAVLKK